MFGLSIKSAVSGMSHLQYDERSMQHQEGSSAVQEEGCAV